MLLKVASMRKSTSRQLNALFSAFIREAKRSQFSVARTVLLLGDMSGINGDKARFNRVRKNKLALRERSQAIRKQLTAAAAEAAKTQDAKPASEPPARS